MKSKSEVNFDSVSDVYVVARPTIPDEIVDFLKSKVVNFNNAWDCGTGNGQVAIRLADFMQSVHGTDISEKQLANAFTHTNITYTLTTDFSNGFNNSSVDLITVAQAAHWFDMKAFEAECKRVLNKNAIVAIWTYHHDIVVNGAVEKIYQDFYKEIRPFFPKGREHVDNKYADINLDLPILDSPEFYQYKQMNFDGFIDYLKSFSAYAKYYEQYGKCPIVELGYFSKFKDAWGDITKIYNVEWPIIFKCYINK